MIQFKDVPYLRPDMGAMEKEMRAGIAALEAAGTFPEAYYALLSLEAPRRKFMTLATLVEAHNTMDTNDEFWAGEQAWFDQIRPRWDALCVDLGKALNATPFRQEFEKHLGTEIFRQAETTGRAFSTAITAELEEESVLSAQYSKISGNLSVELDGKRYTMGELSKLQKPGDRDDREKFGQLRQKAFEEKSEELDKLYDDLVHVRDKMAKKLGFQSYTDMGYCRQGRTGYQREQVAAFRREIEESITPVVTALFEKQRQKLGYEELWDFDEDVSFAGDGPQLKEGEVQELFDAIFGELSPESRVYYQDLRRCAFYDLGDRKGKIRVAYSNYVPLYEMPFIFETFDRSPGAVKTFAHECGHGLHSYLKRGEPFVESGTATSDICEIHSMAMEFFVWPYLNKLYSPEDVKKYQFFHMKNALSFLPYGAAVDEFQTEVYDHPEMTPDQRLALWRDLERRYLPWRKYKHEGFLSQGRTWQRQTHIYKWPFYYIDYVLAQVCALQYHFMDEADHEKAWDSYLRLLRCSGFQSFDETLALAGLESPFAPGVVAKVGKQAMEFLEKNG